MTPEHTELIRRGWERVRDRAIAEVDTGRGYICAAIYTGAPRFDFDRHSPPAEELIYAAVQTINYDLRVVTPLVCGRIPYLLVTCDGVDVEIIPMPWRAKASPVEREFFRHG